MHLPSRSPGEENWKGGCTQQRMNMLKAMVMADYGPVDEHFPSLEERVRSSERSGRPGSPCHSAHGVLYRASLIQTQAKRAKKVRFYRNGDLFFKGLTYAVSHDRYRTFESLLADLTDSPIGDKNKMPNGVRYIFTLDGGKITTLDELSDDTSYVCASTHFFKKVNYPKSKDPDWNVHHPSEKYSGIHGRKFSYAYDDLEEKRDYIYPKLITVIRNGARPRKAVRILLNRKTAHSFQQVMSDISDAVKTTGGTVKKVYTMEGKQVWTKKWIVFQPPCQGCKFRKMFSWTMLWMFFSPVNHSGSWCGFPCWGCRIRTWLLLQKTKHPGDAGAWPKCHAYWH